MKNEVGATSLPSQNKSKMISKFSFWQTTPVFQKLANVVIKAFFLLRTKENLSLSLLPAFFSGLEKDPINVMEQLI